MEYELWRKMVPLKLMYRKCPSFKTSTCVLHGIYIRIVFNTRIAWLMTSISINCDKKKKKYVYCNKLYQRFKYKYMVIRDTVPGGCHNRQTPLLFYRPCVVFPYWLHLYISIYVYIYYTYYIQHYS